MGKVLLEFKKIVSVGCHSFSQCLHNHRMFWQVCQNMWWRQHLMGVQQSSRFRGLQVHWI